MPDPSLAPGDQVSLTIDDLAYGGDGVGRLAGFAVFVPDVCPGEIVRVEIGEVKRSFARARLLAVEQAAPERAVPLCPVYGRCGGCRLQHLDYDAQVKAKTAFVRDALVRVGRLPDVIVADTLPSPLPYGYRNKVDMAVILDEHARPGTAYHGRDAEDLVLIDDCPLAMPEVNLLLDTVRAWLHETGWPVFDEQTTKGLVREVALRWSAAGREATLLLTTGRRDVPDKRPWIDRLRKLDPRLVGVRHRARTRASQTPQGRGVAERVGRPLRVKLPNGLSLRVSPDAFWQVNELLLPTLIEQVILAVDPQPGDHVADMYAGVGTFGLSLAKDVRQVTLLEVEPDAVHDAEANIEFNKLTNVKVEHGQVEQRLAALGREQRIDKLILDPPRQGCSDAVVRIAAGTRPARIAYVSCDPTTLARDLNRFEAAGYVTTGVQPLDLFPQTYHVECVATLVRKE
jgi:23S rRNA (uracil1939-C5)-methyltransferase